MYNIIMETNDGEIARDVHGLSRLYRGLGLLTGKFIDACTQFEEWRRKPHSGYFESGVEEAKSLYEATDMPLRMSRVEERYWLTQRIKAPSDKEPQVRSKLAKAVGNREYHIVVAANLSSRKKPSIIAKRAINRHNRRAIKSGEKVSKLESMLTEVAR